MSLGNWLSLLALTFATFIFNTSEFVPIGLLTDIKTDFGLTEATVGMLISVYAWAVMLLSLPLMIKSRDFRKNARENRLTCWGTTTPVVVEVTHYGSKHDAGKRRLPVNDVGRRRPPVS